MGREVHALLAPELARLHELFALPYRAVAIEPGRTGLLMDDVSPWLLPDERAPLDSDREAVRAGWREVRDRLPDLVRRALWRPAAEIAAPWAQLPHTLVHGDSKVANFAVLPGSRLCALDWAFVGRAPCTFEIGWYVAVNAPRLAGTRADVFRRYRVRLEHHLERALDDALWERLEEAGVVCGALMLLWSKASAVAAGRKGAEEEWAWWEARLEPWAERIRAG